jgi:FkbM family methyltransferase
VIRAWKRHWDVEHFIRLIRWRDEGLSPRVVYDIGAHDGGWSEMCQAVLNPAHIYLFEPQPAYQAKARARQPHLGADWRVIPVALGDTTEMGTLFLTGNPAASSLLTPIDDSTSQACGTNAIGQEKVRVETLDELVARENLPLPDLVKIDVQGFECRVLAGGVRTLAAARQMIVETSTRPIYHEQSSMTAVLKTVSDWGFQVEDISEAFRPWPDIRIWQVDLWLKRTR